MRGKGATGEEEDRLIPGGGGEEEMKSSRRRFEGNGGVVRSSMSFGLWLGGKLGKGSDARAQVPYHSGRGTLSASLRVGVQVCMP